MSPVAPATVTEYSSVLYSTVDADNSLMQTNDLSGMETSIITYVVPSKAPAFLLLNNGVARSYYTLIADTGRTLEQFHTFCDGSYLQRQAKDVEERQMDYIGTVGRDALRKTVNAKLLELLSKFRY